MTITNKDGREIEIERVYGDCSDDASVASAYYADTGDEITEEDYQYITEHYPGAIYEMWFQDQISRAEYFFEGDR